MATEQIEEYLEAIGRLEEKGERITTSSLARERQVAPPSVTEMLGRLAERGLVGYRPRGEIVLTEEGRSMARSVMRRHRLWERFLHDVLGMRWDRIHDEACRLEHATSPAVERELAKAVGENPTCPHGHSIPAADGRTSGPPTIRLTQLPPLQPARVVSVREEDPTLLRELERVGIKPGFVVERSTPDPSGDGLAVRIGSSVFSISEEAASGISVSPVASAGEAALAVPLVDLAPGETGIVHELAAGKTFVARCLALGFTPGTSVTMVQNPRSGPLIVLVRETRVALGRGEAQKIQVLRRIVSGAAHDGSR